MATVNLKQSENHFGRLVEARFKACGKSREIKSSFEFTAKRRSVIYSISRGLRRVPGLWGQLINDSWIFRSMKFRQCFILQLLSVRSLQLNVSLFSLRESSVHFRFVLFSLNCALWTSRVRGKAFLQKFFRTSILLLC